MDSKRFQSSSGYFNKEMLEILKKAEKKSSSAKKTGEKKTPAKKPKK